MVRSCHAHGKVLILRVQAPVDFGVGCSCRLALPVFFSTTPAPRRSTRPGASFSRTAHLYDSRCMGLGYCTPDMGRIQPSARVCITTATCRLMTRSVPCRLPASPLACTFTYRHRREGPRPRPLEKRHMRPVATTCLRRHVSCNNNNNNNVMMRSDIRVPAPATRLEPMSDL